MGKHYKYEIKLKIVQEYLQGKIGYLRLAKNIIFLVNQW